MTLRQLPWTDATAGVADHTSDVAFVWLPTGAEDTIRSLVLATEPRFVALPFGHPMTEQSEIAFADLLDEPFIALPTSAGVLRDYWLALPERDGRPARIGAEANSADDALEAVAAGQGVALMSAGNAAIYARADIASRPVSGIAPSQLAVIARADDHRAVIRDFIACCTSD